MFLRRAVPKFVIGCFCQKLLPNSSTFVFAKGVRKFVLDVFYQEVFQNPLMDVFCQKLLPNSLTDVFLEKVLSNLLTCAVARFY